MNTPRFVTTHLSIVIAFASSLTSFSGLAAENQPGTVKVRAILGRAELFRADGGYLPLGPGMVLRTGDVVQTGKGDAVDIFLGETPGTLRLTERTTVRVDKLSTESTGGFEVELAVRAGEVLGLSKSIPANSRFEIKTAKGIARIQEGRFRIDAQANCVVVEGKLLFAHVPSGGEPSVHTVQAPDAGFFAPGMGVQPAPKELSKEVVKQMRSKLPRK